MRKTLILSAVLAITAGTVPQTTFAGPIESACNASGRAAASRALCSCIQQVANQTLSRSDQREAARFFRDPQRAQDVRMSQRDRDNAFWQRYRAFGAAAEQRCS